MKPRAVVFDFDGTLADSYSAIAASVNHVRREYRLPPLPEEEVKRFVGRGPAHLLNQTAPGCDIPKAVASYRAHHPTVMLEGTYLLPGALETIKALHDRGLRLGICSNKPRIFTQELLNHLDIAGFFGAVFGPEDVTLLKPDPEMLLRALERLEVLPSEAVYVGDMVVDIQTARAAGVCVWVVPTGTDPRDALESGRPDRLLNDMSEVGAVLQEC